MKQYIADAFTDRLFRGNQAPVSVLLRFAQSRLRELEEQTSTKAKKQL